MQVSKAHRGKNMENGKIEKYYYLLPAALSKLKLGIIPTLLLHKEINLIFIIYL